MALRRHWAKPLSKLNRGGEEAAVDTDIGASDKTGSPWRGQKHRGPDQFFGAAKTAHRGVAENLLGPFGGAAILVKQEPAVLFSREKTRGQGIHSHPLGGPLASQKFAEIEHRRLGGRISNHPRQGQMGAD